METRDAYIERIEAEIKETDARIEMLRSKIDQINAENQMAFESDFEDLHKRRDFLAEQLRHLRLASDDNWEKVKGGFQSSWEEFKEKVSRFIERV